MTRRAAHTQATAARTPHPYNYILRKLGQLSDFCPVSGRNSQIHLLRKNIWFLRFVTVLGRLGQKNPGYVRARILGGLGGRCLAYRSRPSALSAPRAPPDGLRSCFQWVAGLAIFVGFCPVPLRSAPPAPSFTFEINILVSFHSKQQNIENRGQA